MPARRLARSFAPLPQGLYRRSLHGAAPFVPQKYLGLRINVDELSGLIFSPALCGRAVGRAVFSSTISIYGRYVLVFNLFGLGGKIRECPQARTRTRTRTAQGSYLDLIFLTSLAGVVVVGPHPVGKTSFYKQPFLPASWLFDSGPSAVRIIQLPTHIYTGRNRLKMPELSGEQDTDIVNSYFAAYQSGQYDRITPFLHPAFTFSDPSFPTPTPQRSRAIFALFCATMAKSELRLVSTPAEPAPDGSGFVVRYTSDYIFGTEKRKVHNDVVARVTLCEGMVGRHVDVFDVGLWGKQALGWWGVGLGACGVLEGAVRWWAGEWLETWCEREEGEGRKGVEQGGAEAEGEKGEMGKREMRYYGGGAVGVC